MSNHQPPNHRSRHVITVIDIINFLTKLNNLMNSTSGRDKITKSLQNSSKLLSFWMTSRFLSTKDNNNNNNNNNPLISLTVKKLNSFESHLSMARKVFRFGKFLSGYISAYHFMKKWIRIRKSEQQSIELQLQSSDNEQRKSTILDHVMLSMNNNINSSNNSGSSNSNNSNSTSNSRSDNNVNKSATKKQEEEKPIETITLIEFLNEMQRFIMANFFFFDMFNWCAKIGLLFNDTIPTNRKISWFSRDNFNIRYKLNNHRAKDYSNYGSYIWFAGMLCLLSADALKIVENYKREVSVLKVMNESVTLSTLHAMRLEDETILKQMTDEHSELRDQLAQQDVLQSQLNKIYADRDKQFVTISRNVCDFGIASNLVGLWDISGGTNALLGLVSALIGTYELWPAK